jgi:hypothetical protein
VPSLAFAKTKLMPLLDAFSQSIGIALFQFEMSIPRIPVAELALPAPQRATTAVKAATRALARRARLGDSKDTTLPRVRGLCSEPVK